MNYETEIISIVKIYQRQFSKDRVKSIIELAQNNEHGIALENLCSEIYEHNLLITRDDFNKLKQMIDEMDLSSVNIGGLRVKPIS